MTIFALILFAILVVCLVAASRPSEFRIERSLEISASPTAIHPLIDDLHNWTKWSPWEGLDPDLRREYLGEPSGKGAIYTWTGNGKAGAGRMTILSSEPGRSTHLRLEFFRPFKAVNTTTFRLEPTTKGTNVSWTMEGNNGFLLKLFGLLLDTEKLVGKDFEKGLASLAKAAEDKI